jgi:hypothetical protein
MEGVVCYTFVVVRRWYRRLYHVPKFIELGIYALMPRFGPQTRTVALPSFAALKVCVMTLAGSIEPYTASHQRSDHLSEHTNNGNQVRNSCRSTLRHGFPPTSSRHAVRSSQARTTSRRCSDRPACASSKIPEPRAATPCPPELAVLLIEKHGPPNPFDGSRRLFHEHSLLPRSHALRHARAKMSLRHMLYRCLRPNLSKSPLTSCQSNSRPSSRRGGRCMQISACSRWCCGDRART